MRAKVQPGYGMGGGVGAAVGVFNVDSQRKLYVKKSKEFAKYTFKNTTIRRHTNPGGATFQPFLCCIVN
jgi:hypothetical protein